MKMATYKLTKYIFRQFITDHFFHCFDKNIKI